MARWIKAVVEPTDLIRTDSYDLLHDRPNRIETLLSLGQECTLVLQVNRGME